MSVAQQRRCFDAPCSLGGGPATIASSAWSASWRDRKGEIIGVHVVEIDWTLPLDADVAGRSEDAQRVLDTRRVKRGGSG